jgi:hypothetical protein
MPSSSYRGVLCLGLAGLLHAAYSAAEWRSYARVTEIDDILPFDIVLQAIIFLVVTMVGVIHIAGDFKEIRATVELEQQTWDNLCNRPSFNTWGHRGRAFSPTYEPPRPKHILGIPERFTS